MRLNLSLTPNKSLVPFEYQKCLVGAFHKWIGVNQMHDEISLYSLSWLTGGQILKNGFEFKSGARWFISSNDSDIIKSLINGIQKDPQINYGMSVKEISFCEVPQFEMKHKFYLNSPVFIKKREGVRDQFYLYTDQESDHLMTQTLQRKLEKAGMNPEGVQVYFDRTYHSPKTKKITYSGIECKASMCPVIIEGSSEQLTFAWNVGIGNSTGIGFGALK